MNRLLALLALWIVVVCSGGCADPREVPRVGQAKQPLTTISTGDEGTITVNARSIGQTFTAPAVDNVLRTFRLSAGFGGLKYQAYIYAWDDVELHPTGAPLWTSLAQTADNYLFDTGELPLESGKPYVFLLTPIESGVGPAVYTCETSCVRPNGDTRDFAWRECTDDRRSAEGNALAKCQDWKPDADVNNYAACTDVPLPATCNGVVAHREVLAGSYAGGMATGSDVAKADWTTKRWMETSYDFTFTAELVRATSIDLQSSMASPVWGQGFTLTATLPAAPAGPTGNVSFVDIDSGATIGTAAIDLAGQAKLSVSGEALSVGDHRIAAKYAGSASWGAASSPILDQRVLRASTTTAMTVSTSPSVFGQPITLGATVKAVAPSTAHPTGSVVFSETSTGGVLGTAPLDVNGHAEVVTSALGVAATTIRAAFVPADPSFASSETLLPHQVLKASTATALASSQSPAFGGGDVTLTASVTAVAPGAGTPTGTVSFLDETSGQTLGTSSLTASGRAVVTAHALALGVHTIRATYQGDGSYLTSTTTLGQQVVRDGATVKVASSLEPSTYGASVTFTATVTPTSGVAPTGNVTFSEGGAGLATVALSAAAPYTASFTTSALLGGAHTIVASYDGGAWHNVSIGSVVQQVNVGTSTTGLASAANPSRFGQTVTFTATVTGAGAAKPTGTMTFLDGTAPLATVALDAAGQAVFATAALSATAHPITARYDGDANRAKSTSPPVSQIVDRAVTTTLLSSSANPQQTGAEVRLTAKVTASAPGAGVPTGTVTFSDAGGPLGTGALDPSGIATLLTSALSSGTHPITARFEGAPSYLPSTSAPLSQVVDPAAAVTTITSSPNPSTMGQLVTFTVRIEAAKVATGTVTLRDDGAPIGTAPLVAGEATFSTSSLAAGKHLVTAEYPGDADTRASTASVVHEVARGTTTTTLASTPNPSLPGQSVTLSATVASAGGTPGGTVTFRDGDTQIGTSAVVAGVATLVTSALAPGAHSLTAAYDGEPGFATSTSTPLAHSVGQASTTTTLASSSNPSLLGDPLTLTATVVVGGPANGGATGATVTFKDGAAVLGTGPVGNGGVATLLVTGLQAGSHALRAEFAGNAACAPSQSEPLTQTVNTEGATVSLTATPGSSTYGESVTFTASVSGSGATPTGTVTFKEGATVLQAGAPIAKMGASPSGVAAFSTSTLTPGSHTITAQYSGDGLYAVASATAALVVDKAVANVTLTSSKNPSRLGESVTFTATVHSDVTGFTGEVELFDGPTSLGVSLLSGGAASFTLATLSAGPHVVKATYRGDDRFAVATSTAFSQVVDASAGTGDDAGPGSTPPPNDAGSEPAPTGDQASSSGCAVGSPPGPAHAGAPALAAIALLVVRRRLWRRSAA